MKTHSRSLLAVPVLLAFAGAAFAALPPLSPEDLAAGADLVVTGKVEKVATSTKRRGLRSADTIHRLTVRIDAVEKGGDAVSAGEEVTVHCWTAKRRPQGWVGPSGHRGIPGAGDRCRFWLEQRDDGTWGALDPNGIETLEQAPSR